MHINRETIPWRNQVNRSFLIRLGKIVMPVSLQKAENCRTASPWARRVFAGSVSCVRSRTFECVRTLSS